MIEFGKFHGHTLGHRRLRAHLHRLGRQDVTRDPELVAAARVIQADLDARGIVRQSRPEHA